MPAAAFRVCTVVVAALALFASASSSTQDACAALSLSPSSRVSTTDDAYATWTIDLTPNRAFFIVDWTNAALRALAGAIGGRSIRVGGSGGDILQYGVGNAPLCPASGGLPNGYTCLNATTARALVGFAAAAGTPMIFGLSLHPLGGPSPPAGPWNTTNSRALLTYLRDTAPGSLAGLELGNEFNSNGGNAVAQTAAFASLAALVAELWPAPSSRPALVGPDADGAGSPGGIDRLASFLFNFTQAAASAAVPIAAMTFHEYIEVNVSTVLQPAFLDYSGSDAAAVVAAVRGAGSALPIWAGEIGPHTGDSPGSDPDPETADCRSNMLCGRFASTLWYADSLAAHARAGVARFFRQDLIGAMYALLALNISSGALTPSPDYYFLHTWQRVVGAGVLAVAGAPPPPPGVRAYAFCARARGAAAVALILVNIGAAPACVGLPAFAAPGAPAEVYAFTTGDDAAGLTAFTVRLNGVLLALRAPGVLPAMPPALVNVSAGLTLPPLSAIIAVVTTASPLPACA